jgi:hypothetical protein
VFVLVEDGFVVPERGPAAAAACGTRALDGLVAPPFRAVMHRRTGDTWAVGAVAIKVALLPADVEGDELVLTVTEEGERMLEVDGRPRAAAIDALERLASGHRAFVLRGRRLEGPAWEVTVDPL